jgi:hypothetical protein
MKKEYYIKRILQGKVLINIKLEKLLGLINLNNWE